MNVKRGLSLLVAASLVAASWAGNPRTRSIATPWGTAPILTDDGVGDGSVLRGVGPGFQAGADHVIAQQCLDGGWGWPHASCSTTYHNITGPIALGILNAYSYTGDPAHLASAVAAGDFDLLSAFPNLTPSFGSFGPAFLHTLSGPSSDPTYSTFAEVNFFDALTAGTYGDPAASGWGGFAPADTYNYIARHKANRGGSQINLRPWDMQYMPWLAGPIGNAASGIDTTVDTIDQDGDGNDGEDAGTQQDMFRDLSVLDGLDTLDAAFAWDLLGLAGGVRGLALNGTTSFPALTATNFTAISGHTTLCQLADTLAGFQNATGSWSWNSALQDPIDPTDQDTQATAYAVLALIAAENAGCGPYTSEIDAARDWLRTMQLPTGGFMSYPGGSENTEVEAEVLSALIPDPCAGDELEFQLALGSDCVQPSETITVELHQLNLSGPVAGFQAFAQFDSAMMTSTGGSYTSSPFGLWVITPITAVGDNIDLASGIDQFGLGQTPTSADALLATLTFTAGSTDGPTTVSFRAHSPPNRFSDPVGLEVTPCLIESSTIIIDGTDPVITCPADISVNADAGTCEAVLSVGTATATDNLDPNPAITWVRSDTKTSLSDPYEAADSPITIMWTATDCAGNTDVCPQTITVSASNEMVVDIDLSPTVTGPFTRCITFELWDCPGGAPVATVDEVISFSAGGSASGVTVLLPCASGPFTCVTARDKLHTLRRTLDPLPVVGTQYIADFTLAGQDLIGGNLNDDFWIDILDFGVFSSEWAVTYGTPGGTTCATTFPHADISGDDTVATGDFTFIQINFLLGNEANCCGTAGRPEGGGGPVHEISTAELRAMGMGHLSAGDLNGDGWLDDADIVEFLSGVRPSPSPQATPTEFENQGAQSIDGASPRRP